MRFGAFFYLKDTEKVCGARFSSDWRLGCLIVGKNIRNHRRNKVLTAIIKKQIINLKVNYLKVDYVNFCEYKWTNEPVDYQVLKACRS